MADKEFQFRIVLIKIQHLLSDEDRKQLIFAFGEDIPRRLSDGSLGTALDVLQTLFDRLKISRNNFDYLVDALQGIERHDCAQRLLEYGKVVPREMLIDPLVEREQNQNEPRNEFLLTRSQIPSDTEILADLEEEDTMKLPEIISKPTGFIPPEAEPMDFNNIDLTPFEDPSVAWTEDYSKLLNLEYHPRAYQIEIIRDAIRNNNTIVCLRTGSGKTFIASVLIKYYFIKRQKTNPNSKFLTLFFVPRKAIRLQQAKAISQIGNLKVQICEDDQTIDQLINTNHVIVSTPQKFVNYKPTIIGLTATISAKDASEKKESVDKNLVSLCGKLGCRTISTVSDPNNIAEINQEISRPKNNQFEYVSKVEYNSYFQQYLKAYENLIKQIKDRLDNHQLLDGQEIGSSGFIGQLILLKQTFERKDQFNDIIIADYLLLLTKRYTALKDLPFNMVLNYVLQKITQYYKEFKISAPINNLLYQYCKGELETLLKKHEQNPTTNSKLDNLVILLQKNTHNNKKGLILVQTTFYVKTLNDYLHNHPALKDVVKSTWIVGQNSLDHSLTINEQEGRLKKFREDECNVLIATDIVQEGLDIPTCSYVIRYEFVSDEIGTIQSRGRARAQDSLYYLVTETDSVNHKREQNNKIREGEMEEAISQWPTMDKNLFQNEVEKKRKLLIDTWEREIKEELQRKADLHNVGKKTDIISCRKCGRELGKLEWLTRRNTMYFINNPEFLTKNNCELNNIYKNFQENLIMGEVKCVCGNTLGGCQKFTDRLDLGTLCALKCKQIKFKITDQPHYIEFAQWNKNNSFDVEELEDI